MNQAIRHVFYIRDRVEKTIEQKVKPYRAHPRHFGALENFTVDWRGARPFTVTLKEYTGLKAGDVKTLTLPNGDKANCDGNYPCGTTVKGRYRQETADVGSYSPNAWWFYDRRLIGK